MLGAPEIGIIALVVVVLFGGRKLPELGAGIGKALANFKKGYREAEAIDISPDAEKSKEETARSDADGAGKTK